MNQNLIQYEGRLSSEVRVQLIDLLNVVSLANMGKRNDLKKLCGIALELLDNAQRYCSSGGVNFEWRIDGTQLVVSITNNAIREDAERLLKTVNEINNMSPEEVAGAFRAQLTNETFGSKGGAGLGMLQIAKKTGSRLMATVEATNNEEYLCTSQVAANLA
ncbi:MAG: DUF6272 family protein [Flavobacteriales bacterium]